MTAPVLALTSVTLVASLGFTRVFAETSSVVPALVAATLVHLLLWAGRRAARAPAASWIACAAALALVGAWMLVPSTTAYGIPTGETAAELWSRLVEGFEGMRSARVPVGPHHGVVTVTTAGVWLAALAADWVAFRARATLSALIPGVTLLTVAAGVGLDRHAVALTVGFVVASLAFLLTHAPAQAADPAAWFTGSRTRGSGAVVRAGLPLVLAAAVAAPLVGPRLPDARSSGVLDLGEGGGPSTRVTVSPLVDIRDRLTREPPVEVLRVRADRPAYWRMAALEDYDGQIWSSLADYESADGELPADTEEAPTTRLVQEFEITGLNQFWLPAAYRPVSIDHPDARVNPDSLTLLTERPTAAGLRYRVESAVPSYTAEDLAAQTGRVPDSVRPQLELPGDVPDSVRRLAREVTAGATDPYRQALALQDFFRREFTYTEEIPAGHGNLRMEDFLLEQRAGYCEQFSSSFAVMARSLGIPARVAVGFRPGERGADGAYRVSSADAHAWPEVHIDPFGWVAFEPTPTRFDPAPGNHTGTFDPSAVPDAPAPGAGGETTESSRPSGEPSASTVQEAPEAGTDGASEEGAETAPNPWPRRVGLLVATAALIAAGWAASRLARRRAARRRRRSVPDPDGSVLAAWEEVVEHLRLDGVEVPDSLTTAEVVERARAHRAAVAGPLDGLGSLVDVAAYSPAALERNEAGRAWAGAGEVVAILGREHPPAVRVRHALGIAGHGSSHGSSHGSTGAEEPGDSGDRAPDDGRPGGAP